MPASPTLPICAMALCAIFATAVPPARALPPERADAFATAARELLGVPYEFGGRMREAGEGIDCQGVLFYAAERIAACGWKSFSPRPTDATAWGELGEPVPGLMPVAATALEVSRLRPGDILWFVDFDQNEREPSIARLHGKPVWVWHTGLYVGDGRFVVGDHFAGKVVEEELAPYLRRHYAGLFVTRMRAGPMPKRCREHEPMRRPVVDATSRL